MRYANWAEFAEYSCRHEIRVAATEKMYYNMHDWCMLQELPGVFYSSFAIDNITNWSVPAGLLEGSGGFYFSEHCAAVLFALRWTGTCTKG